MYRLEVTKTFQKQLSKLDGTVQRGIINWIEKHLHECEEPRVTGKALKGSLSRYWRYRIGDYRLIVEIQDDNLVIVAIAISHRRDVYKKL